MLIDTIITAAITIFVYMIMFYILAQLIKDNSIVDIGWGLGFIVVTIVLAIRSGELFAARILMMLFVIIWGLRLAIHIFLRNKGKEEDFRYKSWRKKWGRNAWWIAFFKVYLLQGLVMLLVSAPIIIVFTSAEVPFSYLHLLGIVLFLLGFYFEAVGDYQLYAFKKDPANKGKIITHGLWKYTRHPNYFGETIIWWGIFLIALPSYLGWIALISPLIITLTLVFVSGVPMLEEKYEGREDWEEYKQKTPMFVPFIK